jgi:hypothetical protein
MTKRVRVNISARVNAAEIKKLRRHGRDIMIVPSATLPDGIVMNGIRYDADEIEKSYKSLERTPAPLGHPEVEGMFVSASDPEGLARGWIGAWNENVRRENGKVYLDKVIDLTTANQTTGGKAVLEAIEKGHPVHTSTGLFCSLEEVTNDANGAKFVARDIVFDHDAILLGEEGAATPDQGVGMMVHKALDKDGQEIQVINSAVDKAIADLDWAGMYLLEGVDRIDKATRWEALKKTLLRALGLEGDEGTQLNRGDEGMNEAQFKELSGTVNALSDSMKDIDTKIATAVANALGPIVSDALKPVVDAQQAVANAQKAKDEAEKTELVNKVVGAKLLTEAVANTLTLEALRELAPKTAAPTQPALGLVGNLQLTNEDGDAGFKVPKAAAK